MTEASTAAMTTTAAEMELAQEQLANLLSRRAAYYDDKPNLADRGFEMPRIFRLAYEETFCSREAHLVVAGTLSEAANILMDRLFGENDPGLDEDGEEIERVWDFVDVRVVNSDRTYEELAYEGRTGYNTTTITDLDVEDEEVAADVEDAIADAAYHG